jgi:purine nucleoside phosphorylase
MTQLAILTDTPQAGDIHNTTYGESAPINAVKFDDQSALLCSPTSADPRATIQALKDLGTTHLWLCESVGALSPLLEVGDWVVADDYIDGTRGQHYTYFSEKAGGYVQQVPPFEVASREALIKVVQNPHPQPLSLRARGFRRGVYVCVSNTRLETPAEATFWTRAGGHLVGRYLSPYLTLARELEMQVAVLAQVVREGGQPGESSPFESYAAIVSQAWEKMS